MRIVSIAEWDRIEQALMKAEIPYKITFDSHDIGNEEVVYDRIINIDNFKIQTLHMKNDK